MRFPVFIAILLGLSLCSHFLEAAEKRSTKSKSRTAKSTKATSTAKSSRKGRRTTTSARRPSQRTPTTERYMEVQQALADRGYYQGEVTGEWGPDSVEALKRFQTDQKLKVDGKLGSLSLIALGLGPKREPISTITARPETAPNP